MKAGNCATCRRSMRSTARRSPGVIRTCLLVAEIRARAGRDARRNSRRRILPVQPPWTRVNRASRPSTRPSLRRVINATGVMLHTNLGRAPLGAWQPSRRLFQPGIRSRHRPARQARRSHRRPSRTAAGRARHRRQQQRRGHLPGASRTGRRRRSGRLARRTDRDRRRLSHSRDHGPLRRDSARSRDHQSHPTSTITAPPSTNARACCCAFTPATSASPASPRGRNCGN